MVYVLKMEYVSKINIFGLNMMVKSGLEKIFLKFLHATSVFFIYFMERRTFAQNYKFSNKIERDFEL